jgi:antitoxin (DNA-binding transcriptional repressor) of toxin-antitoxin stability system
MAVYDEAEAQLRFDELLDRALEGELIVITRDGDPVVEFKPVQPPSPCFV